MRIKTCRHHKILGMSADEVLVNKDKLQIEKEEKRIRKRKVKR